MSAVARTISGERSLGCVRTLKQCSPMNRAGTATATRPSTARNATVSTRTMRKRRRVRRATTLESRLLRADVALYHGRGGGRRTLFLGRARDHHVTQRAAGPERVERIAGHQHERGRARIRADRRGPRIHHRQLLDPEARGRAAWQLDDDLVAGAHALEKAEVRVAMRRHDRGAGRADDRAFRYVAGTEGQGAAAHAGEDDEVDAVGRRPKP